MKKILYITLSFVLLSSGLAWLFLTDHIGYTYDYEPAKADNTSSNYVSEECRGKQEKAIKEAAPLKQQLSAINAEVSTITAKAALAMPAGYYADIPEQYLGRQQYIYLHDLYKQYLKVQDEIDAIGQKYQCLP